MISQSELFVSTVEVYKRAKDKPLRNAELYEGVREHLGLSPQEWSEHRPYGSAGLLRPKHPHKIRWHQQSLRLLGLLERSNPDKRGMWQLTEAGVKKLCPAKPGRVLVAYSTDLGVALWARAQDVYASLDEPIDLILTSVPYLLAKPRAYGNPADDEIAYVDWICRVIEPLLRNLAPTGSLALNISPDTFETGLPSRRLIPERLALELNARFGLHKMDHLIWDQMCRPPGPVQWASGSRQQLVAAHELVMWYSPDPLRCEANNRRVLVPHTKDHKRLIASGGEPRATNYGDGAHRLRSGSFSRPTEGAIQRNILRIAQTCGGKRQLSARAREMGLPVHGATFPLEFASRLIQFLTSEGRLVVDPLAGWNRTGLAAERLGRRWLSSEINGAYAYVSGIPFENCAGFSRHLSLPEGLSQRTC